MPTAILVDGAFFIKRFRAIEPQNAHDARRAAECAHRWACAHLSPRRNGTGANASPERQRRRQDRRELYRIFFYDCPPLTKKMHNPINKRIVDFAKRIPPNLNEHIDGLRSTCPRHGGVECRGDDSQP